MLVTVAVNITDWPPTSEPGEETSAVALGFPLTTCASAGDEVLPPKVESPPYCAVIEWEPIASADVISVALPAVSPPGPAKWRRQGKSQCPLACRLCPLTVAVNITDWPTAEGFRDEPSVVRLELHLRPA